MYNVGYNKNGLAAETQRLPSSSIWWDCPVADLIQASPGWIQSGQGGVLIGEDFCPSAKPPNATGRGTYGKWDYWGGTTTAVTIDDAIEEGGVISLLGATTQNTQAMIASNASMFRLVGPSTGFAAGQKFWMEFRIALGAVTASQQGVFVGLVDNTGSDITSATATVFASGANTLTTTKNLIGFFNRTTTCPADFSVVYQPAAGTAVYPTNLTTLVNTITGSSIAAYAASTSPVGQGTGFVKIGMKYDPSRDNPAINVSSATAQQTAGTLRQPQITFYVNGQKAAAFLCSDDMNRTAFPVNAVFSPVFAYSWLAGTTPVYLDWMYFAQMASF